MRIRQALAATALTLAAGTAGLAAAAPAYAGASGGLVNVYVDDVLSGNQVVVLQNVPVSVAAAVCDVDVNVLSGQLDTLGKTVCPARSSSDGQAWVVWS
ncbi:hypothetical protein [Actinoplanes sp. N902-109]|uniref:hypothetical protein n=1 Tax=Actinoplanes sp. (strain N902-109) TaxID=649831 RepID=UPI0003296644|nr:hypothetical protein [Actinoplanes sp. N902-109]AGL18852.1 hypothetical protein L083_5342 [Actinoplanes sp. N902-109]